MITVCKVIDFSVKNDNVGFFFFDLMHCSEMSLKHKYIFPVHAIELTSNIGSFDNNNFPDSINRD